MRQLPTNLSINVLGTTVFIRSKEFDFSYTPANDVVKDEFKDQYRYFGGLQHNHPAESVEAKQLEKDLIDLAETILKTLKR